MSTATSGRPRNWDRDCILDDALELFWRNGYRTTTTRELEASLGLSQSSIYNAFGSKAELLAAALDRYETRIDAELVAPLEASDRGLEAVDDFLAAVHRWITHDGRRGCMVINLMAEDGGDNQVITRRTRRYRQRVRQALRAALQRAAELGEIDDAGADERTDLLFGMVLGLNMAVRGGALPREIAGMITSVRYQLEQWRLVARLPTSRRQISG